MRAFPSFSFRILPIAAALLANGRVRAEPLDLPALSAQFNVYHSQALAQEGIADAIPLGSEMASATTALEAAGAYCRPSLQSATVRCRYLIPEGNGDGSEEPVSWRIVLGNTDGRVASVNVLVIG